MPSHPASDDWRTIAVALLDEKLKGEVLGF